MKDQSERRDGMRVSVAIMCNFLKFCAVASCSGSCM